MFVLSCFVLGYWVARIADKCLPKWPQRVLHHVRDHRPRRRRRNRRRSRAGQGIQQRPDAHLKEIVLSAFAFVAVLYVIYRFRVPWVSDFDYWFVRDVYFGRHRAWIERGVLSFLLGATAFIFRESIWRALSASMNAVATADTGDPSSGVAAKQASKDGSH